MREGLPAPGAIARVLKTVKYLNQSIDPFNRSWSPYPPDLATDPSIASFNQ
jgi:hypothetical protein